MEQGHQECVQGFDVNNTQLTLNVASLELTPIVLNVGRPLEQRLYGKQLDRGGEDWADDVEMKTLAVPLMWRLTRYRTGDCMEWVVRLKRVKI